MSLTKVSYSMITGTPINVSDFGAVGDGVTNDTAAIRAAIDYAQSLSSVPGFPHVSKQPVVVFATNKTYKVFGNNILGHNYAVSGTNGTTYQIDLCGSQIEWHQTGLNDALVDYAAYIFNFGLVNGSIVCVNDFNTSLNGYLVSANPQNPAVANKFIKHLYDNLKVNGGTYKLKRVFNISGTTHCDQTTVSNSWFVGWETFYYSSNPEAVNWTFLDSTMVPDVNNFRIFHHVGQWSGGIRIIGCELGTRTSGVVFYATGAITGSNNGYVYCNSRMETGTSTATPTTFVQMVDATFGRYELVGMNFYAGGGATSGLSASIRGSAEVVFRDCIVPQTYVVEAQTRAEWDVTHLNGLVGTQLMFDNCIFAQGLLIPNFFDTGNVQRTFRYCVENGLVTPVVRSINSNFINVVNGIARSYTAENRCSMRYEINRNSTGYAFISDYPTTAATIQMPSNILITSIKVNVVTTAIVKLGVFFGASATVPLITVALSNVNPTVTEMIPATNFGICVPNTMGSDQNIIWFGGCDAGNNLVASSLQGWAEITYSGIDSRNQLSATDVSTLI